MPKTRIFSPSSVLLLLTMSWVCAVGQEGPRLGLLPVEDRTGEVFGETYAGYLRRLVVIEGVERGLRIVFLNPGPEFDPTQTDLAVELAREAGAEGLVRIRLSGIADGEAAAQLEKAQESSGYGSATELASMMSLGGIRQPKIQDIIATNKGKLVVETTVSPLSNPESTEGFFVQADIRRGFLTELKSIGAATNRFTQTAPGRAALRVAERISLRLQEIAGNGRTGTNEPAVQGSACDVTFSVQYAKQGTAARNFTASINGRDETYRIRNGKVNSLVPPGHFLVRVTLQNVPYGTQVQREYDANEFVQCPSGQLNAVLVIGVLGEASLRVGPG